MDTKTKTLKFEITIPFELDVPADSPLTSKNFTECLHWKANEYSDGRFPFSSELVFDGLQRTVMNAINEAMFQHFADVYRDELNAAQGPAHYKTIRVRKVFARRDADIKKHSKQIHVFFVDGGKIDLKVVE